MFAGCFSFCRLHMPWGTKKKSGESKLPEKLESKPATVPATTFAEDFIEPNPDEKLAENSQSLIPTKTDYALATVKEVLTLARSAASVVPVPFLQEAIEVALKIIQLCEEASEVEQKVKELQFRVGDLMIVIVDHVTPLKDEESSKETAIKTAEGIKQDIKELLSILGTINEDLTNISAQNRWVIAIYKQLNMNALDTCMNRLSNAMQKFTLANDLHDSALINDLHSRLRKMANTVDDIHHKVDDVYHKVDNIETFLSKLKRSGTQPGSDSLARQEMPLKPEIFHGRDELVEDIAQLLVREETSRVCILGPGGMGKTSVSLAVVELPLIKERFPGGNTVWVPCIEATSATLFLEILHIQLQLPGDKQVTLDKVISELDAQKQPRLIVVDNFETPWNGNQKQVGDIIRRLAMLSHIAILVTMRGSHPPCDKAIKWQAKDIESTDEAACLRVYHDINPNSENDPDVARLLSALGHMPFAVTLMARLGLESQWSAKALLDAWSESGPDMLSNDPEQSMNRSIGLSVESELVKRNPNAGLLLAILSLLPAGTTSENLHWWAPEVKMSMIPSAIATLSQAALLVENKRENSASPVLFVIPVVQSFMQQQNRITQEVRKKVHSLCCEYVLAHACRQDDPTFADKSKALAAEDANIQSILFGSPQSQVTAPSHTTMEALIAFSWYRCDTKPNLETAKHAVMAAKATEVQRYIALALWCLGMTCFRLARNFDSFTYMREAFRIFYNHLDGEVELIRLGVLCGIDFLGGIMQFGLHSYISSSVDENLNLEIDWARMMVKKCATISDHDSDDLVHGCSLLSLGIALNNAQQRQEALCHMDHARTIFVAVGHTFHLARAYQAISRVHLNEHRLRDALDAIEEAWKYAESTASRYIQISVSLDFGKILFSNDQDTKAWKHIEIALMNASYIGQRNIFGPALDYMGYGYLRRGDYQNAYGAYEAASPAYIRGSINLPAAKLCEDNMSKIKWKQENPDAVVGFYRPTGDVDTTLFYPSVQSFASELSVSHS